MYRWKIVYKMKNGDWLCGLYEGPENNSLDVAKALYGVKNMQTCFASHFGADKNHMIVVRIDEISSVDISKWEEKENGDR